MLKKSSFAKEKGTWFGLNIPTLNETESDVVIFGIPFDGGVSYRAGAKDAPETLRENTSEATPFTESFERFKDLKVYDAGDFEYSGNIESYFEEIAQYVKGLVEKGIFFTMLGGDHSVTIPIERGIDKAIDEDFGIIHIDAHFDICDELHGDKLSHGSTERRALELNNISSTDNLYFVGIRSIEPDEYEFKQNNKINVISATEFHEMGERAAADKVVEHMKKFNKVYVTVDIDALDPAFAAGTGTPQFGGLYSRQLITFLKKIYEGLNIIGFDVVEIAPALDPSLTSMFAGRKLIQELWGLRAKELGKLEK